MKRKKVPVGEKAVLMRLNRHLAHEGLQLRKARPRALSTLGDFFVIDVQHNFVVEHHVDVESLARKRGVLEEWEELNGQA